MCQKHYTRWLRYGNPSTVKKRKDHTPLSKWVDTNIAKKGEDECWEWKLQTNDQGYGSVWFYGKHYRVHRLVLIRKIGRRLEKHEMACHTCHNRKCANPNHLYVGNATTNAEDAVRAKRWKPSPGSKNGNSRLVESDVRIIRRLLDEPDFTQQDIADIFDVSKSTIRQIRKGAIWKHIA